MSDMDLQLEEDGNVYVLRMTGALTAETLPLYRKRMDALMKEHNVSSKDNLNFIVDYGKVTEVDSATVANILERLDSVVRQDHKVCFVNVPEKFKNLVTLLKVDGSIQMYDSEQQAREALCA